MRVYIRAKKVVSLAPLTFRQAQMMTLGNVGVASVKERVTRGGGPEDAQAKPLTRRYAIMKSKMHRSNFRDLTLTGDMLRNFLTRTVTDKRAVASVTGRGSTPTTWNKKRTRMVGTENRVKAWANQLKEAWMVFSPRNKAAVAAAARRMAEDNFKRIAFERALGSRQR